MAAATETFSDWLTQGQIPEGRLTPEQRGLLQAAFRFRQQQGNDYYSTRLLGHFLLHCASGLKVAQIARLLTISRPTASRQQRLSSKETVQQAHHRTDGRPYGKLLPRYAGPIAQFLFAHPQASRADLIDFVERTFGVRVSRIALYKFLKKFGLGRIAGAPAAMGGAPSPANGPPPPAPVAAGAAVANAPASPGAAPPAPAGSSGCIPLPGPSLVPASSPSAMGGMGEAPPFSSHGRSTPVPSC